MRRRRKHVRSLFLSDFHIGAKSFDSRALLNFLLQYECDYLYLVGDIIDGWKLKKRWHWDEYYTAILDELAAKALRGTIITYLPGNHDERVRHVTAQNKKRFAGLLGIRIREQVIHRMADGRRFLILHGDQFDSRIIKGPLSRWSDYAYDMLQDLLPPRRAERIMIKGKNKKFSLAKALQKQGQSALSLINNLESAVYRTVSLRKLDGLICGHTHIPVIKSIQGVTYANCGAWLREGHTALAEDRQGNIFLIDWPASTDYQPFLIPPPPSTRRHAATTRFIMREIRGLWPVRQKRSHKLYAT
ncbi:MAG: UDP-2,3-diacylglucosamine diphosphatase [Alphaproteobacteria bacterium]|nr:UDP-2,3-diacylglucosamine diphosphatase [Alphaproteobacteria bacterium]